MTDGTHGLLQAVVVRRRAVVGIGPGIINDTRIAQCHTRHRVRREHRITDLPRRAIGAHIHSVLEVPLEVQPFAGIPTGEGATGREADVIEVTAPRAGRFQFDAQRRADASAAGPRAVAVNHLPKRVRRRAGGGIEISPVMGSLRGVGEDDATDVGGIGPASAVPGGGAQRIDGERLIDRARHILPHLPARPHGEVLIPAIIEADDELRLALRGIRTGIAPVLEDIGPRAGIESRHFEAGVVHRNDPGGGGGGE